MELIPNNPEAERHLIGLTLVDGHVPQGARDLSVTDFYNLDYRHAWRAFLELDQEGQEINHITAYEIMRRNGSNESFRCSELVNTALGMFPGVNERAWVRTLKECALKRFLLKELRNQMDALATESGADVIRALKKKIDELEIVSESTGHFRTLAEIIETDVKPAIHDLHAHRHHKIPTGIAAVDAAIGGGLSTTDVLLIAGVPGSGKSALVLQIAASIAQQGTAIAFLSGEMSDKENIFRLLTQKSKITNLNSLVHISTTERDDLLGYSDIIAPLPMSFDSRTYDLHTIRQAMRGLIDTRQVKVLVIDYVQLLKLNRNSRQDRYERITEVSQEIKRTAMEFGIAIIEVAQFNREGAKSGKPMMHDLEGSSQLEKDTSLIFILDREKDSDNVTLRIVKGRNSGLCEIHGLYTGRILTFEF